mmetsp:Transcript_3006/g.5197  ORF Transcript_3006/g.5197 Transcript_3006/m.5197 type:complete len:445 (-) Transcript_3006:179-1513(-)
MEDSVEDEPVFDVVIIGAGMAGLSCLYRLAKISQIYAKHMKILLLDQSNIPGNPQGSSYGDSRMFRRMYSDPFFSDMQVKALELWKELENDSGEKLLTEHGLLFWGEETDETVEGSIPGAKATMEKLGIAFESFSNGNELVAKFPVMRPKHDDIGIYEEAAGSVNSSRALLAMLQVAKMILENSLVIKGMTRVAKIEVDRDDNKIPAMVISELNDIFPCRQIVLAVNAWTNDMLAKIVNRGAGCTPRPLALNLEVHNIQWGHFQISKELADQYPQWYCFRTSVEDGGLCYGFPASTVSEQTKQKLGLGKNVDLIKVGLDYTPKGTESDSRWISSTMSSFCWEIDESRHAIMTECLKTYFHGVGNCVDRSCSPYCMTQDQYFILDSLACFDTSLSIIKIFAGGNGRAFKFAPLIGQLLAELVTGKPLCFDIWCFGAGRDAVQVYG